MFRLEYHPDWGIYYSKLDKSGKEKIWKKIQQLKSREKKGRHLKHGTPYFVEEMGQYRVCYEEEGDLRTIMFAGNHKQYEKWYQRQ